MKVFLLIILILFSMVCKSQSSADLIPDPGFENVKPCYDNDFNTHSMNDYLWWMNGYWQPGSTGSTDFFFNLNCTPSNNSFTSYPNTIAGYQQPRSGNSFAGIVVMTRPTGNHNVREYLRTELLIPLEAGKKYYAGFYIHLSNLIHTYAIANMGMLFSDTVPPVDSAFYFGGWYPDGVIHGNPQILSDTTTILMDTADWVLVADTFIAQGGEKWLTIGNFRTDSQSIYVQTPFPPCGCGGIDSSSYYFIDDTFLFCLDSVAGNIPPIANFEPYAASYCTDDTIHLISSSVGQPDNYIWSMPGALASSSTQQNPYAVYPNPGTYTVQLIVTKNNGTSDTTERTITINPLPNVTISTPNNTVCSGWHTQITASGANNYTWSMGGSGSPTRNVSPTSTTTYSVVGTNTGTGCVNSDSITITVIQGPTFNLVSDTLCSSQSAITLNAQPPAGTYSGPGVMGNQFDPLVTGNGTYQLVYTYTNSSLPNCIGSDTAYITVENCAIGMQEYNESSGLKVYPNPAADEVIIETNEIKEKEIVLFVVYDLSGRLISTSEIPAHSNRLKFSTGNLLNGVYICKLVKNGVTVANERLVIMK